MSRLSYTSLTALNRNQLYLRYCQAHNKYTQVKVESSQLRFNNTINKKKHATRLYNHLIINRFNNVKVRVFYFPLHQHKLLFPVKATINMCGCKILNIEKG